MNNTGSIGFVESSRAVHTAVNFFSWLFVLFFALLASFAIAYTENEFAKLFIFFLYSSLFYFMFKNAGAEYISSLKLGAVWAAIGILVPYVSDVVLLFIPAISSLDSLTELFTVLKILAFLGPLWMVLTQPTEGGHKTKIIIMFFVVLLIGAPVYPLLTANQGLLSSTISAQDQTIFMQLTMRIVDYAKQTPGFLLNTGQKALNATQQGLNETRQYVLTGQSYEERVDENSAADTLGITFKSYDFTNLDAKYQEGQEISSWAIIEANSLTTPINANTYCKLNPKKDKNSIEGETNIDSMTLYKYDLKDISCTIPRGTLEEIGTHELRTFLNFDYTTSAYTRRYFIVQDELTELQRNGLDPASFYNVPSSDKQGKFTSGPIRLHLIKNGLIEGIETTGTDRFIVGLKIENNEQFSANGMLKNMSLLALALPDGFSIAETAGGSLSCSGGDVEELEQNVCTQRCINSGILDERCAQDCTDFTQYKITLPITTEKETNFEPYVKTPIQVVCDIQADGSIFDESNFAETSFRAYADYTYQISQGKSFSVLKDPSYTGSSFKSLSYCSNLYSELGSETTSTTGAMKDAAKPYVDALTYSQGCAPIHKGMVAFNYRSGTASGGSVGDTGMNLAFYNTIRENDISASEVEGDSLLYTEDFLQHYLRNDCLVGTDKPSIDCALNYFYCGRSIDCAPTKVVMALANSYAQG